LPPEISSASETSVPQSASETTSQQRSRIEPPSAAVPSPSFRSPLAYALSRRCSSPAAALPPSGNAPVPQIRSEPASPQRSLVRSPAAAVLPTSANASAPPDLQSPADHAAEPASPPVPQSLAEPASPRVSRTESPAPATPSALARSPPAQALNHGCVRSPAAVLPRTASEAVHTAPSAYSYDDASIPTEQLQDGLNPKRPQTTDARRGLVSAAERYGHVRKVRRQCWLSPDTAQSHDRPSVTPGADTSAVTSLRDADIEELRERVRSYEEELM